MLYIHTRVYIRKDFIQAKEERDHYARIPLYAQNPMQRNVLEEDPAKLVHERMLYTRLSREKSRASILYSTPTRYSHSVPSKLLFFFIIEHEHTRVSNHRFFYVFYECAWSKRCGWALKSSSAFLNVQVVSCLFLSFDDCISYTCGCRK